jgi:DNA-binding HxlR family transcriptional regulator/putative sterol carrier protein
VKSYGQWCALAKALDVIGERWSLLIVRELFDGPKRYTDLLDGVPGISTDVLAARLKDLEDDGILTRRTLPPPAASKVYELTELGRGLAPAMTSLAKWGMQLLGERTASDAFRPHWITTALRGMLRPDRAKDVTLDIDFELGAGEDVRIRVDRGALHSVLEPDAPADLAVRADLTTLVALADGTVPAKDALADGRLVLAGDDDAIQLFTRLFPQPVT